MKPDQTLPPVAPVPQTQIIQPMHATAQRMQQQQAGSGFSSMYAAFAVAAVVAVIGLLTRSRDAAAPKEESYGTL